MIGPSIRLAAVLLIVASLAALAGCSIAGDPLRDTQWKLAGWAIDSIDPRDVTITIAFADGRVSGDSGVNTYGGPYKTGPGGALTVGPVAATLMAGPEPTMRAEAAYLRLLGEVRSFKVSNAKLTLYGKSGSESLIFEPTRR